MIKKFIPKFCVTLLCLILVYSTAIPNSCHAIFPKKTSSKSVESTSSSCFTLVPNKAVEKLAKAFSIYRSILSSCTYKIEDFFTNLYEPTLGNQYTLNCAYVENFKKGSFVQLSHYLIKKLNEAGIQAQPLYVLDDTPDAEDDIPCILDYNLRVFANSSKINSMAVLYKIQGKKYVADISTDLIAISRGCLDRKFNPAHWGTSLDEFIVYEEEQYGPIQLITFTGNLQNSNVSLDNFDKWKVLYSCKKLFPKRY